MPLVLLFSPFNSAWTALWCSAIALVFTALEVTVVEAIAIESWPWTHTHTENRGEHVKLHQTAVQGESKLNFHSSIWNALGCRRCLQMLATASCLASKIQIWRSAAPIQFLLSMISLLKGTLVGTKPLLSNNQDVLWEKRNRLIICWQSERDFFYF